MWTPFGSLLSCTQEYTSQCSCCTIFTVFYWFLLQVQESMVTFSHFLYSPVLLWHGFSGYIHFTHIIIPCILLHSENCTAAWIIPEQGLEMDVPANCACLPWISPGVCQPCPAADASTTGQDGHTGVPTAIYTTHTNHKGTVPPNPAQFPGAAVPFLPTPS